MQGTPVPSWRSLLSHGSPGPASLTGPWLGAHPTQAFDVVERSFLESIDDALAEKASLQSQLPEVTPQWGHPEAPTSQNLASGSWGGGEVAVSRSWPALRHGPGP